MPASVPAFGRIVPLVAAMAAVVVASNILVQHPFMVLGLGDLLTWGAFTYPFAFLVTDLSNRWFGPRVTRRVVLVGFVVAVVLSVVLANPRIALASGTAFLAAHLFDIAVFDRLRQGRWWRAPLISSLVGSAIDTALFFALAFAPAFAFLGWEDGFATEPAPLLGFLGTEAPRWVNWAIGDFAVKILIVLAALAPYRGLMGLMKPWRGAAA